MNKPHPASRPEIDEIIYLALENGIISRGKACAALKIDRCELDEWIQDYESGNMGGSNEEGKHENKTCI